MLAAHPGLSTDPLRSIQRPGPDRRRRTPPDRNHRSPGLQSRQNHRHCFRYRNKIGLDLALEGLREGLCRRCCTPDQLWRYARTARVWSVMRPYVEAMVADG